MKYSDELSEITLDNIQSITSKWDSAEMLLDSYLCVLGVTPAVLTDEMQAILYCKNDWDLFTNARDVLGKTGWKHYASFLADFNITTSQELTEKYPTLGGLLEMMFYGPDKEDDEEENDDDDDDDYDEDEEEFTSNKGFGVSASLYHKEKLSNDEYELRLARIEYFLYINNEPVSILCSENFRRNAIKELLRTGNSNVFKRFLRLEVLTGVDLDGILCRLQGSSENNSSSSCGYIWDNLRKSISSRKDINCLYIRKKELDLYDFIEKLADIWQEIQPKYKYSFLIESAHIEVGRFFKEFNKHTAGALSSASKGSEIAMVISEEVDQYWGRNCWDMAEIKLNHYYDEEELYRLNFKDVIGMLFFTCKAYKRV